jgi:hypothetical protein
MLALASCTVHALFKLQARASRQHTGLWRAYLRSAFTTDDGHRDVTTASV